jgi:S-adenosylmethionine synthetase
MHAHKPGHFYFSSESVGEGHPDKLCDQVSDAILDACLTQDPHAKVAIETAVKTGMLVLLGEITCAGDPIDYEAIARKVCREVGFTSEDIGLDADGMNVIVNVESQSPEIGGSVHGGRFDESLGAGDQGLMFGYATNEHDTSSLHPLSHYYSNHLVAKLEELRKSGEIAWLRPDCKSQITMEYRKEGNVPVRCHNILISTQHTPDVTHEEIVETLKNKVIPMVIPEKYLVDTEYFINPSKSFISGGPKADAGLTGRKIIVDTYGGWAPHGGGAFSGKDPSKVDRSAAYYARYVAKSLVANDLCDRALVQVAYSIGVAEPLSIHVETYGTHKNGLTDEDIVKIMRKNFDFRPYNIIKELDLLRPIYRSTSKHGHFGQENKDHSWENPKMGLDTSVE